MFEGLDPETMTYSLSGPAVRRVGGRLDPPSFSTVALRVVLDHSLLEIFTGTGQVITTRVYRGEPPGADAGLDFISFGGAVEVSSLHAWELDTIWKSPQARSPAHCFSRLCAAGSPPWPMLWVRFVICAAAAAL